MREYIPEDFMQLISYLKTEDFKVDKMTIVTPEAKLTDVYRLMQKNRIRHVPVVKAGEAIGIISDKDVNFVSFGGSDNDMIASDVMSTDVYSVSSETPLSTMVSHMARMKINSALIHDDNGKIAGIFTSTDALKILANAIEAEEDTQKTEA